MSKKLLFISNIIGKGVGSFSVASIKAAHELGYEYHMAANFNNSTPERMREDEECFGIKIHHIDFVRQPYNPRNLKAYKQIVKLIEEEHFDLIHCNTPIGGVVGRLAGKRCKVKKVIYQAHGFHFYEGAPLINWFIYYPIEKWLAHYTDALITINNEDYERAKKFLLRNHGRVYYVPGVGIDTREYEYEDFQRDRKREDLGLKNNDIMVISMGDLIERKNYMTSLEAIAKTQNIHIHYYICGRGPLKEELGKAAEKLGIGKQVHFLGFRNDVKELLWSADIFLFTTIQEGLPRSLSEAMAAGLPCVASKIRGNTDLMIHGESGFLYDPNDCDGFATALKWLAENPEQRKKIGANNLKRIQEFSVSKVISLMTSIYTNELK